MEFLKENISWIAPVGGWVLAVLAFVITPVRDWIVGKVNISFDKAKDKNKAINDKKIYVSKARFDKEFLCYQELSELYLTPVRRIDEVESVILLYDFSSTESFAKELKSDIYDAEIVLKKYASFISANIYNEYALLTKKLKRLNKVIVFLNEEHESSGLCKLLYEKNEKFELDDKEAESKAVLEANDLKDEITNISNNIIKDVRDYLDTLDVKE